MNRQAQPQQNNNPLLIANIDIEKFLADNAKQFRSVMPKHFEMRTLFRLTVTELRKNPDLTKCTTASLIGALLECAQVGLEIGTKKAFLVPYKINKNLGTKNSPNWVNYYECQFQIGYKGYIELALRTGKVLKISANPVFENDHFIIEYGTNEKLEHVPAQGDRGELIGAYAIARFDSVSGNVYQFEYMTKAEIEEVKARSPSASSQYSPWKTDFYEMAKKTVTKRLCKYLPSSTELEEAMSIDDKELLSNRGLTFENEVQDESKTSKLKQSLQHQKASNVLDEALNKNIMDNANAEQAPPAIDPEDPFLKELGDVPQ